MAKVSNGFIESLDPDDVFVFGSNEAGRHGKGAALTARQRFGAQYGVGEGLTGQSYALPTKNAQLRPRTPEQVGRSLQRLAESARQNPNKTFYLTRVGQGLAGMSEAQIRQQVDAAQMPVNVRPWWTWESQPPAATASNLLDDTLAGKPVAVNSGAPFEIVGSRVPGVTYDVLGMRSGGKTMATVSKPYEPGWLGNPYVAQDAGGPYTREQATKLFGELVEKRAQDPVWREAFLGLKGKKVGYYKPGEKHIHLHTLQDWIQKNSDSGGATPSQLLDNTLAGKTVAKTETYDYDEFTGEPIAQGDTSGLSTKEVMRHHLPEILQAIMNQPASTPQFSSLTFDPQKGRGNSFNTPITGLSAAELGELYRNYLMRQKEFIENDRAIAAKKGGTPSKYLGGWRKNVFEPDPSDPTGVKVRFVTPNNEKERDYLYRNSRVEWSGDNASVGRLFDNNGNWLPDEHLGQLAWKLLDVREERNPVTGHYMTNNQVLEADLWDTQQGLRETVTGSRQWHTDNPPPVVNRASLNQLEGAAIIPPGDRASLLQGINKTARPNMGGLGLVRDRSGNFHLGLYDHAESSYLQGGKVKQSNTYRKFAAPEYVDVKPKSDPQFSLTNPFGRTARNENHLFYGNAVNKYAFSGADFFKPTTKDGTLAWVNGPFNPGITYSGDRIVDGAWAASNIGYNPSTLTGAWQRYSDKVTKQKLPPVLRLNYANNNRDLLLQSVLDPRYTHTGLFADAVGGESGFNVELRDPIKHQTLDPGTFILADDGDSMLKPSVVIQPEVSPRIPVRNYGARGLGDSLFTFAQKLNPKEDYTEDYDILGQPSQSLRPELQVPDLVDETGMEIREGLRSTEALTDPKAIMRAYGVETREVGKPGLLQQERAVPYRERPGFRRSLRTPVVGQAKVYDEAGNVTGTRPVRVRVPSAESAALDAYHEATDSERYSGYNTGGIAGAMHEAADRILDDTLYENRAQSKFNTPFLNPGGPPTREEREAYVARMHSDANEVSRLAPAQQLLTRTLTAEDSRDRILNNVGLTGADDWGWISPSNLIRNPAIGNMTNAEVAAKMLESRSEKKNSIQMSVPIWNVYTKEVVGRAAPEDQAVLQRHLDLMMRGDLQESVADDGSTIYAQEVRYPDPVPVREGAAAVVPMTAEEMQAEKDAALLLQLHREDTYGDVESGPYTGRVSQGEVTTYRVPEIRPANRPGDLDLQEMASTTERGEPTYEFQTRRLLTPTGEQPPTVPMQGESSFVPASGVEFPATMEKASGLPDRTEVMLPAEELLTHTLNADTATVLPPGPRIEFSGTTVQPLVRTRDGIVAQPVEVDPIRGQMVSGPVDINAVANAAAEPRYQRPENTTYSYGAAQPINLVQTGEAPLSGGASLSVEVPGTRRLWGGYSPIGAGPAAAATVASVPTTAPLDYNGAPPTPRIEDDVARQTTGDAVADARFANREAAIRLLQERMAQIPNRRRR